MQITHFDFIVAIRACEAAEVVSVAGARVCVVAVHHAEGQTSQVGLPLKLILTRSSLIDVQRATAAQTLVVTQKAYVCLAIILVIMTLFATNVLQR